MESCEFDWPILLIFYSYVPMFYVSMYLCVFSKLL